MTHKKQREQSRFPERSLGKESGLVQRVRRFLLDAFPDRVPHIVAGYSGGKDSLALLLVLRELARLNVCRLTAVHVDHGLRPDSGEAAERSMQVAGDLDVGCMLVSAPEDLRLSAPGESVEHVARRFRYQALARVLEDVAGDAVAVAHHQRDQAETVLLHLLRGSGMGGLMGMAADGVLPVDGDGSGSRVRVIRPFLNESPKALEEVMQAFRMPVIDDPSNDDAAFRRNRIRHELLPLMEDIAPGAMSRLVSLANIVGEDDAALNDVSGRLLERAVQGDSLDWETFQGAPRGLQRRVIRRWIGDRRGLQDLSLDRIDAVISVADRGEGGKTVAVGGGWSVVYRDGSLRLVAPRPAGWKS